MRGTDCPLANYVDTYRCSGVRSYESKISVFDRTSSLLNDRGMEVFCVWTQFDGASCLSEYVSSGARRRACPEAAACDSLPDALPSESLSEPCTGSQVGTAISPRSTSADCRLPLPPRRGAGPRLSVYPRDSRDIAIDGLDAAAQRGRRSLREYRTRLIADVVTGKLDVREAAARLPDEVEEPGATRRSDAESDADEADADDLDEVPRGGRGMTTDTTERGLERLICTALTGSPCDPGAAEPRRWRAAGAYGGRLDLRLTRRLRPRVLRRPGAARRPSWRDTQPEAAEALDLGRGRPDAPEVPGPPAGRDHQARHRSTCCATASSTGRINLDLFYGTPSPGNPKAAERFAANRFSVTRQLRYSRDETQLALDLCLFINGLPIATFELKNSLTKQTVEDAVEQYKRDRDPREMLFQFGRCVVHFAVDDHEVRFCTHLKGKASWFLPFNQGWNDGAGNPPNPDGLKTDYLWKRILTREGLTDILENYAQVVESKDEKTGQEEARRRSSRATTSSTWCASCWPTSAEHGAGKRYLIQHSAGSGKSQLHRLAGPPADRPAERRRRPVFDSIIVVTDRRILDKQIRDTIKQFAQVGATVGHAERLRRPAPVHRERQEDHHLHGAEVPVHPGRDRRASTAGGSFAIIIDEAHSSQGGKTSAAMSMALSRGRRRRKTTRPSRTRSTASWSRARCCPTPATSPSPPRPRTRRWRSSARPYPERTARSSTGPSTATP